MSMNRCPDSRTCNDWRVLTYALQALRQTFNWKWNRIIEEYLITKVAKANFSLENRWMMWKMEWETDYCWQDEQNRFNVFHVRALYYTKTLITNKCTHRVLSSIVTHSYMFRPSWVIFRENLFVIVTLRLHFIVEWECAVDCVLCTGGVNSLRSGPARPPKTTQYTVNSTFSLNYKVQP
jgi:hypothetical protein